MSSGTERIPKTPSMRLDGLTALVTGAGRGLGRACALALADAGASVTLISRTAAELAEVAAVIEADGGHASVSVCDVTDSKQVNAAVAAMNQVNVLVNAAGINFPEPLEQVTENHFDQIMAVNVKGTFLVSQAVALRMRAAGRGGSIINVSSQMGHVGAPNRTAYCGSKHAVEGMTKAMAVELAPEKIRVNSIGPTFILTPLTRPFFDDAAFREDTLRRLPRGEVGSLEDVMGAVVFLASPAAALVTGAGLVIDGGWTAW